MKCKKKRKKKKGFHGAYISVKERLDFFFPFLTKIEKKQTLTTAYYTKSSIYYNNAITQL